MPKRRSILPWLNIILLFIAGLAIRIFVPICGTLGYCCLGLGCVLLCFQLLSMLRKRDMRLAKVLSCILSICLCYGLVAVGITSVLIWRSATATAQPGCDYIILLGCKVDGTSPSVSLQERIDRAYAYLVENPTTICVVSGGKGNNEDISEAACMFNTLTEMGIDPSRIWLEDRSTSTFENLDFSLALIEEKTGFCPSRCGIVSSEYHLFRAGMIAKRQGVEAIPIPAETAQWYIKANYFVREIGVSWFYLIAGLM